MTGGGEVRRGPSGRPQLPADPTGLLRLLGLEDVGKMEDIGGSSTLNLRVATGDGQLVLRIYREWMTEGRLGDLQRVRKALAASGLPIAERVAAQDGSGWARFEGHLVELERFIPHEAKMDSWERIEAGLPTLGQMHRVLAEQEVSPQGDTAPACNNVESDRLVDAVRRGTSAIRSWDSTERELALAAIADELAEAVEQGERDLVARVPRQLVHGDFWDNNVFFRSEKVCLVTDFDFVGRRARIDDLALTLYYANSTFPEGRSTPARIHRLLGLVDAYDSGLGEWLTTAEREALPWALARAPLAFIAMIAAVDSIGEARHLAAEMHDDVRWALEIARDIGPWREAFLHGHG